MELLDKLQKQLCRTVGPSHAASIEPLADHRNVASLSLFYRYYSDRCSSELAQLVPLPFSQGGSTRYSDRLLGFSVTIPRCYKSTDVYLNSFFPSTARPWNFLVIEYFPLTYDLSGFKACVHYFLSNFYFQPNDRPSKTMKNVFFISSKKLFSFWRYFNFFISVFPAFSPSQPLRGRLFEDKS